MSLPTIAPTGALASGDSKNKLCTLCKEMKPISEFYKHGGHPMGLSSWCKKCSGDKQRSFRLDNPDYCKKMSLNRRKRFLKSAYGISQEQYDVIIASQKNKCPLCGSKQSDSKKLFPVDHDHKTGKVRGVLCINCNTGIGQFMESAELLRNAADYLESCNYKNQEDE